MITLLERIFIKQGKDERRAYGILCGTLGIALNLLLFAGKYLAGFLSGSIAVMADAFNNLSDAAAGFSVRRPGGGRGTPIWTRQNRVSVRAGRIHRHYRHGRGAGAVFH